VGGGGGEGSCRDKIRLRGAHVKTGSNVLVFARRILLAEGEG